MLKRLIWMLCLFPGLLHAQNNVTGDWLVKYDIEDIWYYDSLTLTADNGKLGGSFNGATIEGTVSENSIHFVATNKNGKALEYIGVISGDGTMTFQSANHTDPGKYTARHLPQRPPGPPQRHEFTPTSFYREFSAHTKPVLNVWPGDTVHTTTVGPGGTHVNDVDNRPGGNPETGPFYIETAMPGDVLAIHFNRLRLNRDWAITGSSLVPRVLNPAIPPKIKDVKGPSLWHLDSEHGVATPINPSEDLKNFSIPVRPMLGCVAVAPRGTPSPTADSGIFGGNMDVNEIVEGTTVYLPIIEPGALLYIGDGHAVQGDGEVTGSGLETSMEVEFTVNVLHTPIMTPRVETPTHLIAVGLAGSLDDAIRSATVGLEQWQEQDYKLTPSETVQVLNTAVEYSVNEVADRNAGILAKINKKYLTGLAPAKP